MVEKKKLNLHQKLVVIRESIGPINKDTEGYGYKYVSGSQILSAIRDEMNNQGVLLESHLLYPTVGQNNYTTLDKYKKEKIVRNFVVSSQMKMIWINAEDPKDRIEIDWFMSGEQKDPSQALGSGLTYSERYFLMKYFNTPTDEDDPDGKNKNDGNGKGKNKGKGGKTESDDTDPFAGDYRDGSGSESPGKDEKLVTEKQLKRYYALTKEASIDIEILDAQIKKKYKVEHKNQLNMSQIDEVFKYLDEEIKKNSQ